MLYLVHHGDAVGPDVDPMRPLSERGRAQVDALAREAGSRGAKPDVIWHSGKLRARQTAEAYWRCCNPLASFSAVRGLQPTDPTGWIVDAIAARLAASCSSATFRIFRAFSADCFPEILRLRRQTFR